MSEWWEKDQLDETERQIFRMFATAYPHEAAEQNWKEFLAFTQERAPGITEAQVRAALERTP